MIIYKDILNDCELLSDTFDIKDVGDGLWEIDLRMITKGGDNFVLEGANASAEGEDAEEDGEAETTRVLDIVDMFRLQSFPKISKKEYTAEFKKYAKSVLDKLKTAGNTEEATNFQKGAPAALKKILANYDNYDMYVGESFDGQGMYVLVDFRDDGVTPYATYWRYGFSEMKV